MSSLKQRGGAWNRLLTLLAALGLFTVSICASANGQVFKDDKSPCKPFRLACTQAGFVLGDKTKGNRLIGDCLIPLVAGGSPRSKTTGHIAQLPVGADASACSANIHTKGNPTTGVHTTNPASAVGVVRKAGS